MQHFRHLDADTRERMFFLQPEDIAVSDGNNVVATALGATLYIPATRADLTATVHKRTDEGVRSIVIDLEDAVADHDLQYAVENTIRTLNELSGSNALVFVRARTAQQIRTVCAGLTPGAAGLAGFVVPKFTSTTGAEYLDEILAASTAHDTRLLAMPVLESAEVVHRETRDTELVAIRELLGKYRDIVLAVRIGATDMCGTFGIRRDRDLTIYDVRVVADVISAIVNHLGRNDGSGFVITGPVWEYFADHERMFRPLLRQTPFVDQEAVRFRQQLVSSDLDALLREVALDRANGIQGKTVIHPSHVPAVHALSAVTHEEYHDALDILASDQGGAQASGYRNKMNELGPHRNWAKQTMVRARAFGVTNEGITFVDLLTALAQR
ncbi:HpcH/HpaI aldolase/citrate lyase family protein [Rhodococcus fascians]|uniref:HpcH/HpaI aldolase/citrate lyase family protein n=1 Tax=Rhodococcoides fascians TaxID=1828 RepID=UPI0019612297|nr:HpcH/HpaI aldolase/citrate lyase family protein [Rhodococcus fascians]MBM7245525.1 HpcH/HpaI aldolase/citrate lyase family protein [Rhodococcus fascians]MBY3811459.1 HpcH/HpaI aldolase/citrate lyase family protein [Rhodococcus fascians]MBY3842962.1 HpcH/HpaI aldolase/citrate lyase family protein [Rhodococcus fascians]MBY3847340.1 HpcH/HpaI aldolase/citrate lyase family protein [Rhodococcus fascians]MBY3852131.1 HpcH/HpaI aldolase/citrate lyase family protein [Rhodococcus fascians]